jgi:hypothetical protein
MEQGVNFVCDGSKFRKLGQVVNFGFDGCELFPFLTKTLAQGAPRQGCAPWSRVPTDNITYIVY